MSTMQRIFQHYHGSIPELIGECFSSAKALIDSETQDVILLWLENSEEKYWLRIFIDGTYCGIDKYFEDCSEDDLDDDIYFKDISSFFINPRITNAEVVFSEGQGGSINLILSFFNNLLELKCKLVDGDCSLTYT